MPTLMNPMQNRSPGKPRTKRGSEGNDLERDVAHDYRRICGLYLRDLRLKAGLTQDQLAEHLGMGATGISAIENGRNNLPPEHYEVTANLLGVDRHEFGWFMLRYTNPWLFAMLSDKRDRRLKEDIEALPIRAGRLEE